MVADLFYSCMFYVLYKKRRTCGVFYFLVYQLCEPRLRILRLPAWRNPFIVRVVYQTLSTLHSGSIITIAVPVAGTEATVRSCGRYLPML